jgi:hypothetical protein
MDLILYLSVGYVWGWVLRGPELSRFSAMCSPSLVKYLTLIGRHVLPMWALLQLVANWCLLSVEPRVLRALGHLIHIAEFSYIHTIFSLMHLIEHYK